MQRNGGRGAVQGKLPNRGRPRSMISSLLPAIPVLGSEVASELRPLPHPLAVQSSLLTSVASDRDRAILQLEFGDGPVYQYFGVPVQSYHELLRAASDGAYFQSPHSKPIPLSVLPNATPD